MLNPESIVLVGGSVVRFAVVVKRGLMRHLGVGVDVDRDQGFGLYGAFVMVNYQKQLAGKKWPVFKFIPVIQKNSGLS